MNTKELFRTLSSDSPTSSVLARKLTRAVQSLANVVVLRGFPRLVWILRRVVIGSGIRIIWYLSRFKMYCDSSSYPSVMAGSGFVYSRMDRILKMILKPDMVFFDVGANVGFVSLLACTTIPASQGKVYAHCFEPDPGVFEWLSMNRQLNSQLDIAVNSVAVGAQKGEGELTVSARSGWSTMAQEPPEGFSFLPKAGKIKVHVTTLDIYCREHELSPAVIKIDVEGLETAVLMGARETLKKYRPFILIEFNPLRLAAAGTSGEELIEKLSELDYDLFHIDFSIAKIKNGDKRKNWQELAEVLVEDLVMGRDFDVLAVPSENVI